MSDLQLHGSSRWSNGASDLSGMLTNIIPVWKGMILGLWKPGTQTGIAWDTESQQGHGLCFAPNGSGKGASVIIPALLSYGGSIFCIDPKGENAWVTAEWRRKNGHRVVILDPWGEVNRLYGQGKQVETATKFNPIAALDPDAEEFDDELKLLGFALIVTHSGEKAHFPDSAREYVIGLIALVKEMFGEQATLRHVRRLITEGDPGVIADLCVAAKDKRPNSLAARKLARFMRESEEISGVRSTAETQTAFLDSEALMRSMEHDPETDGPVFDLMDFNHGGVTIYTVCPPDKLVSHAAWLRLMVSQTIRVITRAPRPPSIPHLMLVDEMGTIGPLKPLETGFGLLRGYGVRFFGFFQTVNQMRVDYPQAWQNFVGNCSYLQFLGARDMETAEFISKQLGTTTVTWNATETHEKRQEGKPLMFPQEIMSNLGKFEKEPERNHQIVIASQGSKNYSLYQNPYFKQAAWVGCYRTIPWMVPQTPTIAPPPEVAPKKTILQMLFPPPMTATKVRIRFLFLTLLLTVIRMPFALAHDLVMNLIGYVLALGCFGAMCGILFGPFMLRSAGYLPYEGNQRTPRQL